MKKKRILVLGSSGQIGKYLCDYLEETKPNRHTQMELRN